MSPVTRSLPAAFAYEINDGKAEQLTELFKTLDLVANEIEGHLFQELISTGKIERRPNVREVNGFGVSERFKYEVLNNIAGNIRAFKTSVETRVKEVGRHSSLTDTEYRLLYRAVAFGHCFGPKRPVAFSYEDLEATQDEAEKARDLAHYIAKRFMTRPRRKRGQSFTLGAKVVTLDLDSDIATGAALRLSSLTRGKRLSLPIIIPEYTRDRADRFTGAVQVAPTTDGFSLRLVAEIKPIPYTTTGTVVGLDVGAVTPVATSDGDLLGRDFWGYVQHLDNLILRASKGATSGLEGPWESPRWQDLNNRLRDYVTNELRRVLKSYLLREQPAMVVVEDLLSTFAPRKGRLSPRMRRLFRRVGRGVFVQALSEYSEEFGFEVVAVNSWYTSKGCSHCGHQSSKNRPQQDTFHCQRCGIKGHADVHAAREVLNRCSVRQLSRRFGDSKGITGGRNTALDYLALRDQEYRLSERQHWESASQCTSQSRALGRAAPSGVNEHEGVSRGFPMLTKTLRGD